MEHKAVKKAKKGLFSIVFGRTALILMLVLIQLIVLVGVATILNDYAVYVYGGFTVLAAVIVIYIINERGNPAFNMTWVLLILIFPAFGCLFYIWVKSQLGTRYIGKRLCMLRLDTAKYMQQEPQVIEALRESKPANANLAHYMQYQLNFPTYRNTQVQYFACGEEKFPVLLEELKKAEKFIFLEYFIVEEGYMWGSVLEILKEKAAAGVEVRFMYDGMCSISLLPPDYPKKIRRFGIQCKMFSPIRPVLSTTQNNRDHRKICVIDGKTGFTGNAGYCYVCAVRQDERLFIVALLGCGWPGNKNYKWSDTKKLLSYGRENYQYVMLPELPQLPEIPVTEAAPGKEDPYPQKSDHSGYPPKQVMLKIHAVLSEKDRGKRYLLKKTETITWETELPDKLPAPIQKNQKIGTLHAKLNGKELLSCLVTADDKIDRITYKWYVDKVFKDYFH